MTKIIARVNPSTDTFQGWLNQTNVIIDTLANNIITVNNTANGDFSVGNGFVTGTFGSNTIVASTIRGGNVSTSANLSVTSNVSFTGATSTFNSTAVFNVPPSFPASNTTQPALRIPTGSAITTPANGDVWATTSGLFYRVAGVDRQIAFTTSSISGTAITAGSWTTARTLTLTGAITGNVTFDGSANMNLVTSLGSTNSITANNLTATGTSNVAVLNVSNTATFAGTVLPSANSLALGSTTKRWDLTAVNITASGNVALSGTTTLTGTINLNANTSSSGQFYTFNSAVTGTPTVNAGIIVNRGSSVNTSLFWDESAKTWKINANNVITRVVFEDGSTQTWNIIANTANNTAYFGGQPPSYYANVANFTGTIADASIPSSLAGRTFTSSVDVQGSITTRDLSVSNGALTVNRAVGSNTNAQVNLFSGNTANNRGWTITSANTGVLSVQAIADNGTVQANAYTVARSGIVSFTSIPSANGGTVWTSTNQGAASGLDADLLDGQQGSYYANAANLTGTLADARLPTSMAGKTLTGTTTVTGVANISANVVYTSGAPVSFQPTTNSTPIAVKYRSSTGVDRWGVGTDTSQNYLVSRYNTSGTLVDSPLSISLADGSIRHNTRTSIKSSIEDVVKPTITSNTLTIDLSSGNVFEVDFGTNITSVTINNIAAANNVSSWVLRLNHSVASRTITWPTSIKWPAGTAPTLTSSVGSTSTLVFYTTDGGTTILGFYAGTNR